jgi:hypothetical protein
LVENKVISLYKDHMRKIYKLIDRPSFLVWKLDKLIKTYGYGADDPDFLDIYKRVCNKHGVIPMDITVTVKPACLRNGNLKGSSVVKTSKGTILEVFLETKQATVMWDNKNKMKKVKFAWLDTFDALKPFPIGKTVKLAHRYKSGGRELGARGKIIGDGDDSEARTTKINVKWDLISELDDRPTTKVARKWLLVVDDGTESQCHAAPTTDGTGDEDNLATTEPVARPEDPTDDPEDPTADPVDPTDEPPTDDPVDPIDDPEDPTDAPDEDPIDDPEDPTDAPDEDATGRQLATLRRKLKTLGTRVTAAEAKAEAAKTKAGAAETKATEAAKTAGEAKVTADGAKVTADGIVETQAFKDAVKALQPTVTVEDGGKLFGLALKHWILILGAVLVLVLFALMGAVIMMCSAPEPKRVKKKKKKKNRNRPPQQQQQAEQRQNLQQPRQEEPRHSYYDEEAPNEH